MRNGKTGRSIINITFKPLAESDFPLLLKWLESPHVKQWWDQDISYDLKKVQEKFGAYVHELEINYSATKHIYAYIVYYNDIAIGYIQAYNVQEFFDEDPPELVSASQNGLVMLKQVQGDSVLLKTAGVDLFIGELDYLHKGFGSLIIAAFLELLTQAGFGACMVDPAPDNKAAVRAYEKAGFQKTGFLVSDKFCG